MHISPTKKLTTLSVHLTSVYPPYSHKGSGDRVTSCIRSSPLRNSSCLFGERGWVDSYSVLPLIAKGWTASNPHIGQDIGPHPQGEMGTDEIPYSWLVSRLEKVNSEIRLWFSWFGIMRRTRDHLWKPYTNHKPSKGNSRTDLMT